MCTWIQMMIFCGEGGDRGAGVSFTANLSQKGNVREDNWHQLLPKLCFLWKHPPPPQTMACTGFQRWDWGRVGEGNFKLPWLFAWTFTLFGPEVNEGFHKGEGPHWGHWSRSYKGCRGRGPPTRKKMKLKVKWCISKICLKPQPNMSFKNGSNK